MTLTFHIDYHTEWGEEVRISGNIPELGSHEAAQAVPLHTADGTHWEVTLEVAATALCPISYEYSIYRDGKAVRTEWNTLPRTLSLPDGRAHCHLRDSWRELPEESYLYTSAFTDVILARPTRDALPVPSSGQLVIRADAPGVESNCRLAVCGNQSALGNWDATHALPMNDARFPCWEVEIDVAQLVFPVEYKFVICRTDNHQVVAWEAGDNRTILSWPVADDDTLVITLGHIPFALPRRKEAGVAIPVFSLRSNHSFGIGDFGDLRLLIDWAALTGQRIVQILPINDTTATHTRADSYPYNAISIYALHPMYVDFTQMPRLKDAALQAAFDSKQTALNALPTVDYETVEQAKWEYLHRLYEQEGEGTLSAAAFRTFVSENDTWLSPYTHFCCERDADKYDADFYAYIQYHLHLQLLAATHHARACGIVLKGDIPIGISRYSVSATVEPELFNMEGQAGAPPDDFAVDGQNWGFPTYRWDVMARDGYRWWQNRFRKMAEYFDAYRIDHILGFFRIWEIPVGGTGLQGRFVPALPLSREEIMGYGLHTFPPELFLPDNADPHRYHPAFAAKRTAAYQALAPDGQSAFDRLYEEFFYHRHNDFWRDEALKKLPRLIGATRMLPCGEDLGMIPACVPEVMNALRILTLEVQRMPKDPAQQFGIPADYPYLSVDTFSTHDMTTLRGWWEEDADQTFRFWRDVLRRPGTPPAVATPDICRQILRLNLAGSSLFCIFSLQDWLSIDARLRHPDVAAERINVPSDPHNYWNYRMHLTLEQLLQADEFNADIRRMIAER